MMHVAHLRQWRPHQIATIITTASRSSLFPHRKNCICTRSSSTSASANASVGVVDGIGVGIDALNKDKDDDDDGSILFLSPSNWPEPNATAAGTRTMSLLQHFSSRYSVHFGCGAKVPQSLTDASSSLSASTSSTGDDKNSMIHWHQIKPNRSAEMKSLLQNIHSNHGPIRAVVFDRFYAEEAFSFRIRELCPDALLVLDMQDVHSLRLGRQCLVKEMDNLHNIEEANYDGKNEKVNSSTGGSIRMTKQLMQNVMEFNPTTSNNNSLLLNENSGPNKQKMKAHDTFLREVASVHRSDLVLVCSSVEMKLLESWNVPKRKLVPASFFCMDTQNNDDFAPGEEKSISSNTTTEPKSFTFEDRQDFISVGGFKHPPNVDSIKLLRHSIWPKIRAKLPTARVHIYGAYPTTEILSMHDEKSGFIVHGHVDDLDNVLSKSRVLLAPLRFGAGIKGKIVDAWRCGCVVVTTPVGAEGMGDDGFPATAASNGNQSHNDINDSWGGAVVCDSQDFADAAIKLYTRKDLWKSCQDKGIGLLHRLFNGRINLPVIENSVRDAIINLRQRRQLDIIGAILWRNADRSTEYFSKWIELKESLGSK